MPAAQCEHDSEPVVSLKVPAAQDVQAPAAWPVWPALQMHSLMLTLASTMVEECGGHPMQSDSSLLASRAAYVPRAQLWQSAGPGSALNVPDAHGEQPEPDDKRPV